MENNNNNFSDFNAFVEDFYNRWALESEKLLKEQREWGLQQQQMYEYKKLQDKKINKFLILKKYWDNYFQTTCAFNPEYSQILFHVFLSKYLGKILNCRINFNNELIEPTLHAFIILTSGLGKGQGTKALVNFLTDFEDKLNLVVEFYTETTDAGLAGTRKSDAEIAELKQLEKSRRRQALIRNLNRIMLYNSDPEVLNAVRAIQHAFKIKDEELEDGEERIDESDYINKGSLVTADFLIFPEASTLFSNKKHAENARKILQDALDINGFVAKKLGSITIRDKANAAVIFTSYMFEEFKVELLKAGLLQRVILYIEEPSQTKALKIAGRALFSTADRSGDEERRKKMKFFMEKLEEYTKDLDRNLIVYVKDKEVIKKFKKDWDAYAAQIFNELRAMDVENVLIPFLTRGIGIIIKIAAQCAVINGREYIIYDDLEYALNFHQMIINSVFNVLERTTDLRPKRVRRLEGTMKESDVIKVILSIVKQNNERGKKPNQKELVMMLKNNAGIKWGEVRLKGLLNRMEINNLIKTKTGAHNQKLYYVP
ncbi:MAG: hypothetical protein ACTSYD_02195 [Candidatus Heimdallarchaeaceae archaeon]